MKIWIGICLLWLMGRVAMASEIELTYSVKEQVSFDAISRAAKAVEGLAVRSEFQDKDQTKHILKALNSYKSPESFVRAPLAQSLLPVPKPKYDFSSFENSVYTVLAQRTLYPFVRVVYDLSGEFRREVKESTYLIKRAERIKAQSVCFSIQNYSKECVTEKALGDELERLISLSLRQNDVLAKISLIKDAMIKLLSKEGSSLSFHERNFYSDASRAWRARHKGSALFVTCLSKGGRFTLEEFAKGRHCKKAFEHEYFSKNTINKSLQSRIERSLFGPYSDFKKLVTSLLEEALPYNPICFGSRSSNSCLFRKYSDRLAKEWSDFSTFNKEDQNKIIRALVTNLD